MKNNKLIITAYLVSVAVLSGCNQDEKSNSHVDTIATNDIKNQTANHSKVLTDKQKLDKKFKQSSRTLFKYRAMAATMYGVSKDDAGYEYQSELEMYDSKNEAEFRQSLRRTSLALSQLSADSKIEEENRKVVKDILDYFAGFDGMPVGYIDPWMGHSAFLVNQINGPMIDIPNNLINSHTIKSRKDAESYLQRLSKFSTMTDSINSKLLDDSKAGWMPPKIIVEKTISYLQGFTSTDVNKTSLVTSFEEKLDTLDELTAEEKESMVAKAKTLVANNVYSGFDKIRNTLISQLPEATIESGIWAQPKGSEYYQYSISKLGDTDLTADEIHETGLQEVERILTEMDIILSQQGYKSGSVGERMVALNEEDKFLYSNDEKGRAELLDFLNQTTLSISKKMEDYFASVPPYPVKIKRIPVATQDSSAGGYYTPPSIDGSVPGIYWINLRDTKANPKFDLKTLTFHEAIPGHHWQVALNLAQEHLPLLRRIAPYNAYVEGWALYSEQMAYEMGMYENDPFGNLGRLKAELFRAVRLVVDTGMHSKKWSREKAIEYMAATTGTEINDVTSEIERYMVWPGQALGYKLGMLKILSLREYAKEKLGANFDIKEFHDVVLLSGAVPMKVLDENVKAWVEGSL